MKIVYLNPTLCNPDGIERVLINQANYMADAMGYEVTIILTDGDGLPYGYPLSGKVNVIQLNIGFYAQRPCRSLLRSWWLYYRKLRCYKQCLAEKLLQIRPDITVSMLRRELNFLYMIPDGSRKIGWVHLNRRHYRLVDFGPWRFRPFLTHLWQALFIRQLKRLDALVVLTDEDRWQWQQDLPRVVTIPNPLSFCMEETVPLHGKNIPPARKVVLAVGRYAHQKGFDRLIHIWSKVHLKYPDWQLHIYGRGERQPYQQLVNALQVQDSCFLHPFQQDVQSLYKVASVFAFPSRYEGFGLTLTEAMHCGLPCVSFDCPCGPKDIITDGENGFLAETPEQFACRLAQLMEDDSLRQHMGERARQSSFRYAQEEIMKKWVELFQSFR